MARKRHQAPHQAKTGGQYALLPHEVMDSPAYLALAPVARALLMELLRRFNGHNNGKVSLDQRTARGRLGASPAKIVDAYDQLLAHGFIEISAEASRHERRAREWELTWITSGGGPPYKQPSFAYRDWRVDQPVLTITRNRKQRPATTVVAGETVNKADREKFSVTTVVADQPNTATTVVAEGHLPATTAVASEDREPQISAIPENAACYDSGSAYKIPSPPAKESPENTQVSDVEMQTTSRGQRTHIGGSDIAVQLVQWEREINADPAGCAEMGYVHLLNGARDRCAGHDKLCGWIDRLIIALAPSASSHPERPAPLSTSVIDWSGSAADVLSAKIAAGGPAGERWAAMPTAKALAKVESEQHRRKREQQLRARRRA